VPPEGVHIPPPSFRPLLVAIGFTALVAGMVIGGWALAVGVIALVLTLLGWLWDARREYVAVEAADRTGHLDLGGAPAWPKATFAVLAILVVVGLVLTTQVVPDNGTAGASAAPGASGAPAGGGTTASAAPSAMPAADVTVTAQNVAFTTTDIEIPAGKPFKLAFDNRDSGVPHDVVIKDASGAVLYKTEPLLTGPAVSVYDVPAIAAGQYTFVCTVHPNMKGTVTAK
jgi:plastocyanin